LQKILLKIGSVPETPERRDSQLQA